MVQREREREREQGAVELLQAGAAAVAAGDPAGGGVAVMRALQLAVLMRLTPGMRSRA